MKDAKKNIPKQLETAEQHQATITATHIHHTNHHSSSKYMQTHTYEHIV